MKKALWLIITGLLSGLAITASWIVPFYLVWSIVFTVSTAITYLFYLITELLNHKARKLALFSNILVLSIVALFTIFYYTGLLSHFSSLEEARKWFESFGIWAWLIFFIIQILQVVVLPIPAQITTIAGVLLFGPWIAFVISAIAIVIGSFACFAIGKLFGVKIAYKLASKQTVDKYRDLLTKKGRVLLPVMFLFPAFPDDLLCFVAGTTKMTWRYFIIVTLLTRLIGVACICWFGSGDLIPFHGWGIPVWIVIGIVMIVTVFLLFKYQEQFEEWVIKTFTKDGKKIIAEKHRKAKEKQILKECEENSKQDKKDYVNFEDGSKTKDDYINFSNKQESNIVGQTKSQEQKEPKN